MAGRAREFDERVLMAQRDDNRIVRRVFDDRVRVMRFPGTARHLREIRKTHRIEHFQDRPDVQQRAVGGGDFDDLVEFHKGGRLWRIRIGRARRNIRHRDGRDVQVKDGAMIGDKPFVRVDR